MYQRSIFQRVWTSRYVRIFSLVFLITALFLRLKEHQTRFNILNNDLDHKLFEANLLVHKKIEMSNFGAMANRMSAIAAVAETVTRHSSLDQRPLMAMLEESFPWWIQSKPIYTPWNPAGFKSQGSSIVVSVGDKNAHLAAILIVTLRNVLKSKIPIEIAYAGTQDLSLKNQEKLRHLAPNIHLIDMTDLFDDESIGLSQGTYSMRPFALLASRYSKTILVDADVLFLQPPDKLFDEHPGLKKTGLLFYHDRTFPTEGDRGEWVKELLKAANRSPSDHLKESLFFNGESDGEADSGVVAIDKSRPSVFISLMFTAWMNTRVREVTYQKVYGDKETYWIAPELMGLEYYFPPWYAGNVGNLDLDEVFESDDYEEEYSGDTEVKLCSHQMLHMNYNGTEPFWINGGLHYDSSDPEKGYANWSHWCLGKPDEFVEYSWDKDQYDIYYSCMTDKLENMHEFSADLIQKVKRMTYETEKIKKLFGKHKEVKDEDME